MSPEMEEFRKVVLLHAKKVTSRAVKVDSEASTNASLVQPFLTMLGYEVGNPDDVSPEHRADFSEKYQNKVDYAILDNGKPVIALESKKVGSVIKNDLGQLKSYFNALPSVKLGILTDGLKYEFYADSDKPNMMDDDSFLRLDFAEIDRNGTIDDNILGGIASIRKGLFNPENVGADAKSKLLFDSFVKIIKEFKSDPSDDFIRLILTRSEAGGKIAKVTQKIVDANRDLVKSAMEAFVAQEALARFGYAPKDLIRTPPDRPEPVSGTPIVTPEPEAEKPCPTEGEENAIAYTKKRLLFLVRNEVLFQEVEKIKFRKSKTSFRIYYDTPNKGVIFDYREQKDGKVLLQFPALDGKDIPFVASAELDECLLKAFTKRVSEAGVSLDTPPPALRAIKGGLSGSVSSKLTR